MPISHGRHHIRRLVAASLLVSSCGHSSSASLSHADQVAASCPADSSKIAALVETDASGSARGLTAQPAQQQVIHDVAERTAICGGHLRVTLFAGSTIGVPVFDGDLKLDGATATARLRKADGVVDGVTEQIIGAISDALKQLADGATDIAGQYQPAAEYIAQLSASGNFHLELTILTDGIQTAGQYLGDPTLTVEQAESLADPFVVPELKDAAVRLIGIGRQADGASLPTPYVAALRAFHTAICERTNATCIVVTDAAGA